MSGMLTIRTFLIVSIFQAVVLPPVSPLIRDYSMPVLQKCEDNKMDASVGSVVVPSHRMSTGVEVTFRLSEKCATRLPHCLRACPTPMTSIEVPLTLTIEEPTVEEGNNSFTDYYEVYTPAILFTPKSYLRVENEYFSQDDFCVYSQDSKGDLVLKICPSKCTAEDYYAVAGDNTEHENDLSKVDPFEVCVPKCCSLHKVLDLNTDSCEYTKSFIPWTPMVYRSANRQICGEKRANLKLHYVQVPPSCDVFNKYFLKSVPGSSRVHFRLLTNGSVVLRELGGTDWVVLERGTYCLDGVKGDLGDNMDQVLLVCGESGNFSSGGTLKKDDKEERLTPSGIAYVVLLFSGIPFLLITAVVYLLVWGQQNVHGWTLFSHTLAMLLHYLAQAVANTVSRIFTSEQNGGWVCMVVGVLNHYFVMASFFWLTVINYDLFSMFRHLQTTVGRSRGMKRFAVYSVVAWGIPFFVVFVSVLLDQLYGLYGDDGDCEVDVIVPLYGHKSCYIAADARPYYLYYPVGVLMVVNLMLAGFTVYNMWKHDMETKRATGEVSMRHRRKFSVMAKLFVVMGLVWVFELFVWSFIKENEVLPWYLVFPDVFNFFQAVAIFLLFACQPKILGQVENGYPGLSVFTGMLKKLNFGSGGQRNTKQTGSTSVGGGAIGMMEAKA